MFTVVLIYEAVNYLNHTKSVSSLYVSHLKNNNLLNLHM